MSCYAHTQEAYRDAKRMERCSCIGTGEQDREAIEERRNVQRERMIERAMDELYGTEEETK